MTLEHIKLAVDGQGVATLTLDHASQSTNLVSSQWIGEMERVLERVASDAAVTGVIVASSKPSFMAGADLKAMVAAHEAMTLAEAAAFSRRASAMHRRLETMGKPVVAAINGHALGGGFELALACHRCIVADDARIRLGLPEVTVGLLPGSGGTQRLIRRVGVPAGLELLLEGTVVSPGKALALGMVDAVVAPDALLSAARQWLAAGPEPLQSWDREAVASQEARGLLAAGNAALFNAQASRVRARTRGLYPAPMAILATVFEGMQLPFDKALALESSYFATLLVDPVARNLIRTGFINKGRAEKGAARPPGVPKRRYARVGVLGAGLMGAGIAQVTAAEGADVVLLDVRADLARAAVETIGRRLQREVDKGRRDAESVAALLGRIRPTGDFADLAGCELVIEAVFEDVAIKAQATAQAEAVIPADAIFATNTSTLPITNLATSSCRPEQYIGLHFFSPVERMPLVEVIVGARTSPTTLAQALDFIRQLGKTPIVVNDSRGFYTSRVFQTFIHEGAAMLGEGVSPALIENGALAAGMPIGPLALLDEVTIDLPLKIVEQSLAAVGDDYQPPCGTPVMRTMRDALGRSSRKAGGGFYEYPQGDRGRLWSGLADAFPVGSDQPEVEDVKNRFLAIQAIEAVRCLDEGVIATPADGDLGSVLGWGFPAYTGGPLSMIDTLGLGAFVANCERLAERAGPRFQPPQSLRLRAAEARPFYDASGVESM